MTPKEKAKELVDNMFSMTPVRNSQELNRLDRNTAKLCAFIAADEVIDTLKDEDLYIQGETNINEFIDYWIEVQREIKNL